MELHHRRALFRLKHLLSLHCPRQCRKFWNPTLHLSLLLNLEEVSSPIRQGVAFSLRLTETSRHTRLMSSAIDQPPGPGQIKKPGPMSPMDHWLFYQAVGIHADDVTTGGWVYVGAAEVPSAKNETD
jgi:hypothetical protein